jgi:hypothetical protein
MAISVSIVWSGSGLSKNDFSAEIPPDDKYGVALGGLAALVKRLPAQ